jgi:hypothetical protein
MGLCPNYSHPHSLPTGGREAWLVRETISALTTDVGHASPSPLWGGIKGGGELPIPTKVGASR